MNQNQTGLARSSTYEKLPANEEEAARISSRQLENNNNDCKCTGKSGNCTSKKHFEGFTASGKQERENVEYSGKSDHSNIGSSFTFSTFVKTPASNICSSVESISTQSSAPSDRLRRAEGKIPRGQHAAHAFHPESVNSQCESDTVANSVEDTSGISSVSSSSNQQSRKTCLVTTV